MKIRTKLIIFSLFFVILLACILAANFYSNKLSENLYVTNQIIKLQESVENSIKINNELLSSTVNDYTYWTEFASFVLNGDTTFRNGNLAPIIDYSFIDYLWTYNLKAKNIYFTKKDSLKFIENPINPALLLNIFDTIKNSDKRYSNFFIKSDTNIIVVNGATIHSSNDRKRIEKPSGFFLLGKIIDTNYLKKLSLITNSNVIFLLDTLKYNKKKYNYIYTKKNIYDYNNKYVASLIFVKNDTFISENNAKQKSILIFFIIVIILTSIIILFIYNNLFTKPFKSIILSLDNNNIKYVEKLLTSKNEFGKLSRLIDNFIKQKQVLENEIEERKQISQKLEETNKELNQQNEEILKLNSDLSSVNEEMKQQNEEIMTLNEDILKKNKEINNQNIILHKKEELLLTLKKAVEQSENVVVITNLEGEIEYTNKGFTDLSGYLQTEVIGKKTSIFNSGYHSGEFYKNLWDTIIGGDVWKGEFYNKKKNGEMFWEFATISPVKNANDQIINFIAIKVDITEKKQIEEQLKQSEERYRTVIENVGDGIGLVDSNENFLFTNTAAENIFGVEKGKLVGRNIKEFITKEQLTTIQEQTKKRQQGNSGKYELEINRANGSKRYIYVNAVPQFDIKGNFVGAYGVFNDFTDRKLAEQSEIIIKNQLRAILDNSNSIIYLKDSNFNYLLFNKEYQKLFKVNEIDIIGKSDYDIHPKYIADKFREIDQKVLSNRTSITEEELAEIDGKIHYYLSTKFLLYNTEGNPYAICGLSTDITQLKQRESDLKESEEKYRILFERSDDAILLIEGQTFRTCNDATVKLFKSENQIDFLNKQPFEISPEYQPDGSLSSIKSSEKIQEAIEKGKAKFEWVHKRANGEIFPAEVWLTLIPFNGRQIVHSIVRDLTFQKKAQLELKLSEQKFNSIVSNANEGIFIVQEEVFKFINYYGAKILGVELGSHFIDIIYPDDRETVFRMYKQKITKGNEITKYNYRFYNSEKEIRWAEISSIFHIWEDKPAVLAFISDITDRIKNENEIKDYKEKIDSIIQNAGEGILVVQNEIIVFINPKITELIGLSENKIINKPFLDLVYERDKLDVFCHLYSTNINIINNNISFQYFKHKSENDWASINTASIIWEGNAAILVFFSDITNQKKAEQQILQQTEELKLQAEVLENSNFEITIQKEEIQKTHKQIVSSINYASLIQKAILPQHEFIDSLIPNHFIIYKPRDIVSGDFYFVKRIKNKIILAVADCTGHGVPGAILSMLGIALLNEIIRKPEIITADIVLNELRNEIKNSLHQTGIYGEQQDGMDIAICVIDTENLMLQFAGAYNPLWIFRKINDNKTSNKYNFIELKADRMPIGIYVKEKPFTQQIYQLQKNDVLYMFSDGFYSQFGQNNNTKYKLGKFKTFISSICTKEIHEQQLLLEEEYTTWKGKTDQTDDVLVMGLKI